VGNIGGLFSTPVINHPEVGILGLAKEPQVDRDIPFRELRTS